MIELLLKILYLIIGYLEGLIDGVRFNGKYYFDGNLVFKEVE